MAVRIGVSVSREMFQRRHGSGIMKAGHIRAAERGGVLRVVGEGADADHGISRVIVDVHHRCEISVDVQQSELLTEDGRHGPGILRIPGGTQRHIADPVSPVADPADRSAFLVHKNHLRNPAAALIRRLQVGNQPQRLFRVRKVLAEQQDAAEMVPGNHLPDFVVQLRNIHGRRFLRAFRFRHFLPDPERSNHHLGYFIPKRHPGQHDLHHIIPVILC